MRFAIPIFESSCTRRKSLGFNVIVLWPKLFVLGLVRRKCKGLESTILPHKLALVCPWPNCLWHPPPNVRVPSKPSLESFPSKDLVVASSSPFTHALLTTLVCLLISIVNRTR
ncbi:hypothetical protein Plhal304r1_c018g0063731 [Plasmopara halstedii]